VMAQNYVFAWFNAVCGAGVPPASGFNAAGTFAPQ
jgi:hypothetical protein